MNKPRPQSERWWAVGRGTTQIGLILVAIAVLVVTFGSPSQERIAISFFVNVLIVLGLQIFMGNSGVTNFGFISFAGIGAYATAILTVPVAAKASLIPDAPLGLANVEVGFVAGVVIAVVVSAIIGLVTGLALTKQAGIAIEIATLALLVIVHVTLTNWVDLTGGSRAFFGIPLRTTLPIVVGSAIVVAFIARWFKESETGLLLRATREDAIASAAMGVMVRRVRLVAWVLSASVIGFAGALDAHFLGTINPDAFYLRVTFLVLAMLLIGGQRTVSGPVLGAVLITLVWEVTRIVEEGPTILGVDLPQVFGLPVLFLGLLIMVTMKFRPSGLLGDVELDELTSRRSWWKRGGTARVEGTAGSATESSHGAPPDAAPTMSGPNTSTGSRGDGS